MTVLSIGDTERISDPTQAEIESSVVMLNNERDLIMRVISDDEQQYFVQATRMQPDLFLLEYRDRYGHMAADEPLSGAQLTDVLTTYAGGDDSWIERFSWAPVE